MAEGARLESVYTATYRGFESLSLRQIPKKPPLRRFFYARVACAFGARAMVDVAQDARPTGAGANVAMVVVAQNARPTGAGSNVAMVVVAQNSRRTVGGGPMSRWLMSRKMRDLRWWDVQCHVACAFGARAVGVVAQDARPTTGRKLSQAVA